MEMVHVLTVTFCGASYNKILTRVFRKAEDRDQTAVDLIKSNMEAKHYMYGDVKGNTTEELIKQYYDTGCCTINCSESRITFMKTEEALL